MASQGCYGMQSLLFGDFSSTVGIYRLVHVKDSVHLLSKVGERFCICGWQASRLFILGTLRASSLSKQKGSSLCWATILNPRKLLYEVTKWSQWVTSQWLCSIKSRASVHLALFLLRVVVWLDGRVFFFLMEIEDWFVYILFCFPYFSCCILTRGNLIHIFGKGIQQYFLSFAGHSLLKQ